MLWNSGLLKYTISILMFLVANTVLADSGTTTVELQDGRRISDVKPFILKQASTELSILNITIGTSKLADVKNDLGGNVFHEGDASSSIYVLCYLGPDNSVVAFESSEMGGNDHVVTTANIYGSKTDYRFYKKCIKSSKVNGNLNIGNVHLGMSKESIRKLKGAPSKDLPGLILYEFQSNEVLKGEKFDIRSSLEIGFSNEKSSYISISKTESN